MPRIIFLNRYFYPDHSATSQILSDLAFHLAGAGGDIHVITSRQLYDEPAAQLPPEETVRGVHVHRVATTQFGRSRLIGRGLDYLSFYRSVWRRIGALAKRGDILVAKTDPPLLSVLALCAAKSNSTHLVNWLQDLYPEVAIKLGVPFLKGPLGTAIALLRNRSLRLADANVVLGKSMAARLRACGVPDARIHIIANWTDDEAILPVLPEENPFRREWGLEGKFALGYSGNLGRAHEFETVLAAAERLRDDKRIVFVFIGGGQQFDELKTRVHASKLEQNFRFVRYQNRNVLKYSLSAPDVHWMSLRPALEGLIFPSKLYGIAAAGRPVIAIAAKDGEIAELLRRHKCGIAIQPGDAGDLAQVLTSLSRDPLRCAEMGRQARAMLNAEFSRRQALADWESVLTQVAG